MNLPPKVLKQRLRINDPLATGNKIPETPAATSNLKFINVPMAPAETNEDMLENITSKTASHALQNGTESLPVLVAFQEFLETERTKMRKRLFVLSLSYLLILALTICGGLVGGFLIIKKFNTNIQKVEADFQVVQSDVAKLQTQALKSRTDTDTLSARLSAEAVKIRTDLESSNNESNKKTLAQVNGQEDKISKINETISSLQKENSTLHNSLNAIQTQWKSMTNELAVSLLKVKELQTQHVNEPEPARQVAASFPSISIAITPRGQNRQVDWRIPIPE